MIDVNKPIETENGEPARILTTNLLGDYPLAVAIKDNIIGVERVRVFDCHGVGIAGNIRNVRRERVGWVNIYKADSEFVAEDAVPNRRLGGRSIHTTRESALGAAISARGYLDTVPIEWEE